MNIEAISKRFAGSTEVFLKKHGPAILTGVGVVGFAATTYLVGKAVLNAQQDVEEFKKNKQVIANRQITAAYTDKQRARDMGRFVILESAKICRIFVPAASVGAASVLCVIAAHGLMQRKQTALLAAYTALDAGFKAYRQRVRDELGEEKELELYRRPTMRALDQTDGSDQQDYEILLSTVQPSLYSKFFDESNPNWTKTAEWNMMFIRGVQNYMNDRLIAYGYVFLNEAYEALGMERSQAGQIVGWKKDGGGDGYVDFGLYDLADASGRAFVNGLEASCIIDFNVDGPIVI